jgi:hypothetical protein
VRALTVIQPWAWLIIHGGKTVENRVWPTRYRGPLLIHAAAATRQYPEIYNQARTFVGRNIGWRHRVPDIFDAATLRKGGFIGVVDVVDVCGKQEHADPWNMPGYFGWYLANPRPLEFQPWKGAQRLWGNFEVRDGRVVEVAA